MILLLWNLKSLKQKEKKKRKPRRHGTQSTSITWAHPLSPLENWKTSWCLCNQEKSCRKISISLLTAWISIQINSLVWTLIPQSKIRICWTIIKKAKGEMLIDLLCADTNFYSRLYGVKILTYILHYSCILSFLELIIKTCSCFIISWRFDVPSIWIIGEVWIVKVS